MRTTLVAMRWRVAAAALCVGAVTAATSCGSSDAASTTDTTAAPTAAADEVREDTPPSVAPATSVLFDFAAAPSVEGWSNQDDPVMGGRSQSSAEWRDGALVFGGEVSLENNGGFASVRSPSDPALGERAAGMTTLVLEATGDGRTYVVQLRTADALHIARVRTEAGVDRAYELPVSGFTAVDFMLREQVGAPPLDPSALAQVALYATDGQEGPFELAITRISAVA